MLRHQLLNNNNKNNNNNNNNNVLTFQHHFNRFPYRAISWHIFNNVITSQHGCTWYYYPGNGLSVEKITL